MPEVQLVVFELNDEVFAADISHVKEIIRYKNVFKLPQLPKFVEGVVELRGMVIPIIDLNKRFELGNHNTDKKTKIIITEINGKMFGFKVNDVSEVKRIWDNDIENSVDLIKGMGAKSYIGGIAKSDDKLITVINFNEILLEDEIEKVDIDQMCSDMKEKNFI